MKQMQLSHFCTEYDIKPNTARQMIHSKGFPAYKIGGKWYVDIAKYEEWRDQEHRKSYRWA